MFSQLTSDGSNSKDHASNLFSPSVSILWENSNFSKLNIFMEGRPHLISYTRNTGKALVCLGAGSFLPESLLWLPGVEWAARGWMGGTGREHEGLDFSWQAQALKCGHQAERWPLLSHAHLSLRRTPGPVGMDLQQNKWKKNYFLRLRGAWKLEQVGGALQPAGGATGGISRVQPAHGALGCFSAAPSFSAAPNVVWGGLCNRVSLQSQRVPLLHGDGRDSLHGGRMRKHRAHLWNHGFSLDAVPSIWIFKPSESQKGRLQIIIGCVFIVYLHWS